VIILLTDDSKETSDVRALLNERKWRYVETDAPNADHYRRPTLLVDGAAFIGIRAISRAINYNLYV
jgi:hypothetical protein